MLSDIAVGWDEPRHRYVLELRGFCPICEQDATFRAESEREVPEEWHLNWFRGKLACAGCGSIPRMRALAETLRRYYPNWRQMRIHESSPGPGGLSAKLAAECPSYIASQYDRTLAPGAMHPGGRYRAEDLEEQSFADASFDLVITQDVFEHLMRPDRAIREIARTLKPGGAHVMTVPIVNATGASHRRARSVAGEIVHLLPPIYHGNPIDSSGALVTVDWGYDIVDYLAHHSGMAISMIVIDDLRLGIRAAYNEVLICRNLAPPPSL